MAFLVAGLVFCSPILREILDLVIGKAGMIDDVFRPTAVTQHFIVAPALLRLVRARQENIPNHFSFTFGKIGKVFERIDLFSVRIAAMKSYPGEQVGQLGGSSIR